MASSSKNLAVRRLISKKTNGTASTRKSYTKCAPRRRLLKWLEAGLYTDITFQAAGGSVKAHRSVLAAVSPVFAAMFRHNMLEHRTSMVKVPELSIQALELFLIFVYSGANNYTIYDVDTSALNEYCVDLMEITHKYQLSSSLLAQLVPMYSSALQMILNPDNCWDLLLASARLCAHKLADRSDRIWWSLCESCFEYIVQNFFTLILESDSFHRAGMTQPHVVEHMTRISMFTHSHQGSYYDPHSSFFFKVNEEVHDEYEENHGVQWTVYRFSDVYWLFDEAARWRPAAALLADLGSDLE